jgi:hypothetical protein
MCPPTKLLAMFDDQLVERFHNFVSEAPIRAQNRSLLQLFCSSRVSRSWHRDKTDNNTGDKPFEWINFLYNRYIPAS